MTIDVFKSRLDSGKSADHVYERDGRTGLIAVWRNGGTIVLTWEECERGRQYDESEYTRDERHEFASPEAAVEFLARNGAAVETWRESGPTHRPRPAPSSRS